MAGLLHSLKKGHQPLFWNVLLAKPWEIGVQHVSLVLNCLEESQLNEGVPQHAELRNFILTCWEKVKDWAKSALSCISAMTLLEKTLFAFFASSPYVFEKILKDPFYELLTTMNDPVALLKAMNYQNLPDELVDKLLLKMNDGDVRISKILLFSNISREKIHELIDNIQRWQARYPQLNESLPKASLYNKTLDRENRYLEFSRSLVHLLIKFASNFESALEYLMIWACELRCGQMGFSFQKLSFEAICQFNLVKEKHLGKRAELAISLLQDADKRNSICYIDDFGFQEHETRIVELAISYYDSPDNTKGVCYASEAYGFYKNMLQILDLNLQSSANRSKIRCVLNEIFLSNKIEEKRRVALEILDKHSYLSFRDDMFEKLLFCHPFFENSLWRKRDIGKKLPQIIYEKLIIKHIEWLAGNVNLDNRSVLIDQLITLFECFYNNFSCKSDFRDVFNGVFSNESAIKLFETLGQSQDANRITRIIKNYSSPQKIGLQQCSINSLPLYVNENNKISQEREKLLNLKEICQVLEISRPWNVDSKWRHYLSFHDWPLDQLVHLSAPEMKFLFEGLVGVCLTTSTFIEIVKTYLFGRELSWLNVIFLHWNPSINCLMTQEGLLINEHLLPISKEQIAQVENVIAHLWKKLWNETSYRPRQRLPWEAPVEVLEIMVDRNLLFSHQTA